MSWNLGFSQNVPQKGMHPESEVSSNFRPVSARISSGTSPQQYISSSGGPNQNQFQAMNFQTQPATKPVTANNSYPYNTDRQQNFLKKQSVPQIQQIHSSSADNQKLIKENQELKLMIDSNQRHYKSRILEMQRNYKAEIERLNHEVLGLRQTENSLRGRIAALQNQGHSRVRAGTMNNLPEETGIAARVRVLEQKYEQLRKFVISQDRTRK